jgi:hypothetical protein
MDFLPVVLPVFEAFTYAPVKLVFKEEAMFGGSVLHNGLKWAEQAIVGYNQKHSKYPLQSSIVGARLVMFSQEWFDNIRCHLEKNAPTKSATKDTPRKNLCG